MAVQISTQSPINFKRTGTNSNVIQFNNNRQTPPMPESAYEEDAFYNQQMQDIMRIKAMQKAEKKEKSKERWNKANVIFSGMIGVGVLGSMLAMLATRRRTPIDIPSSGFKPIKDGMGDATVKFKTLIKDSLPKLESDSINPKTKDFIKTIKDRLALSEDVAKYSGSKSAEQCLLIHGATGTGKTFSARLLANELNAEYAEIDFPKIASKYVGEAASNIKQVFENTETVLKANPDKRYVLVFNEIDSMLVPMKDAGSNANYILENRTAFLNGLDLVKDYKNLTIIGTTNANPKSGQLDFAALGRFGNIFEIELPTEKEIIASLKWHLRDCEAVKKHDFFGKNQSKIESFAKKLHKKKYSQRDVEKIVDIAQTKFGIDIAKKNKPLEEHFDIKYLEDAFEKKGATTGEMQEGANNTVMGAWKRFKAGLAYWLFGGKKS